MFLVDFSWIIFFWTFFFFIEIMMMMILMMLVMTLVQVAFFYVFLLSSTTQIWPPDDLEPCFKVQDFPCPKNCDILWHMMWHTLVLSHVTLVLVILYFQLFLVLFSCCVLIWESRKSWNGACCQRVGMMQIRDAHDDQVVHMMTKQ